jgi:glycosyltransferase involved in cell wall biosynthesis
MDKKQLEEEFNKDFYHPDYFSKFKINGRKRKSDISAIIPTYNRCPFSKNSENYEYNPLFLCIKALLMQRSPINEIIIVDDASSDCTKGVVKDLELEAYATKGVKIRYFLNAKRGGSSVSRNLGAKHASSKYLFFLDDDCVPAPHLSFVSGIAIKKLEKSDKNFSVLVLPIYDRSSFPKKAVTIEDLTKTFLKREDRSASFNSIPLEYAEEKGNFLNKTMQILKPLQVFQTWGHFIVDRKKYLDVGGFPDFATWPNKAGEEQEFACRLIENAYTLYYLPDPKASSCHGAFGAKIGIFSGNDWLAEITNKKLSLIKFSEICESGIASGNRVNMEDYLYSKIISTFCITYKRNTKEAINWARVSYKGFVDANEEKWYPAYAKELIYLREEREKIWHKAIKNGLSLLFKTEKKKLIKLNNFMKSLRRKGELEENARKHLLGTTIKKIFKKILR